MQNSTVFTSFRVLFDGNIKISWLLHFLFHFFLLNLMQNKILRLQFLFLLCFNFPSALCLLFFLLISSQLNAALKFFLMYIIWFVWVFLLSLVKHPFPLKKNQRQLIFGAIFNSLCIMLSSIINGNKKDGQEPCHSTHSLWCFQNYWIINK